jgi:hypothetical protein
VVVLTAKYWLVSETLPDPVRLLILVAIGAATYCGLAAWRAPELRAEVRGLRRRRGTTAAPQPA